jgi:hypothetical protein
MNWTSLNTPGHAEYISGDYRIAHELVGFGISLCRAYYLGGQIAETAGHDALKKAQDACAEHASHIPELHWPVESAAGGGK